MKLKQFYESLADGKERPSFHQPGCASFRTPTSESHQLWQFLQQYSWSYAQFRCNGRDSCLYKVVTPVTDWSANVDCFPHLPKVALRCHSIPGNSVDAEPIQSSKRSIAQKFFMTVTWCYKQCLLSMILEELICL